MNERLTASCLRINTDRSWPSSGLEFSLPCFDDRRA